MTSLDQIVDLDKVEPYVLGDNVYEFIKWKYGRGLSCLYLNALIKIDEARESMDKNIPPVSVRIKANNGDKPTVFYLGPGKYNILDSNIKGLLADREAAVYIKFRIGYNASIQEYKFRKEKQGWKVLTVNKWDLTD